MTAKERLANLIAECEPEENLEPFFRTTQGTFGRGRIPKHYKRCTIPESKRDEYAKAGAVELISGFSFVPYYTQAMIVGAVLSGDYDDVTVVTCSQYGKTITLGHLALLMARAGHRVNVAAATSDKTSLIMTNCLRAVGSAAPDLKKELSGEALKKVDKIDQSMSKVRLSFPKAGYVQSITLGATYGDLEHNQAVGRGGAYIVDEAAQVPEDSMIEIARREFSSVDGTSDPLIMISNPHQRGTFYDRLTCSDAELELYPGRCVIWMDARTAVEEGRWTADKVMMSDFASHADTCLRYLLCELPQDGDNMFGAREVYDDSSVAFDDMSDTIFLGIDSAYKGKDKIQISAIREHDGKVYFTDIEEIDISGSDWIDGVTTKVIIDRIARIYHNMGAAYACIDIAYGIWLHEGLTDRGCRVHAVNFAGKPTPERVKENHYAAKWAGNKRAEMHLDLQNYIDEKACAFAQDVMKKLEDTFDCIHIVRKPDMRVLITPKAEIKSMIGHSPDAFDAALLALHAYLIYNFEGYGYV